MNEAQVGDADRLCYSVVTPEEEKQQCPSDLP